MCLAPAAEGCPESDTRLIRWVEATVIDEMHRRNRLLRLPQDHAVALLLKAYGEMCRSQVLREGSIRNHIALNQVVRGLSCALRWVLLDCSTGSHMPGRDNKIEEDAAARLILTGASYARLCAYFVPWSRGMMQAHVDATDRRIRFALNWEMDSDFCEQQMTADVDWWLQEHAKWPTGAAEQAFQEWYRTISVTRHGLFYDLRTTRRGSSVDAFREWAARVILPEVPETTSFGNYSLGELRTFLAGLKVICHCISELELRADGSKGPVNDMGSWVLSLTESEAGEVLSQMTSLPPQICEAIYRDLTFDPRRFHASISASPFVVTRSGTLFLSPWNVRNCVPQRSAIAALTSGSAKRKYDLVSGLVERHHLANIAREIEALGFRVLVEKRFRLGDIEVKPDILVLDNQNALVGLIEFKNSLAATNVGEVADRMAEYERGIAQIRRAGKLFVTHKAQMRQIGIHVLDRGFRACLLFRIPVLLPLPSHEDVLVYDWHTLQSLGLQAALFDPPSSRNGSAPSGRPRAVPMTDELQIGKWTFELPVLFFPQGQKRSESGCPNPETVPSVNTTT
jgi:hypothetical protein